MSLQPYYRQQVEAAAAFVRLERERDALRVSLGDALNRASELEQKLKAQSKLEDDLRDSQEREHAREEFEKTQVDRLLSLAHTLGG
jgi:hypothetical protein